MNRFSTGRTEAGGMTDTEVSRRAFVTAAGAATAAGATATGVAGQSPTATGAGTGTPDANESAGDNQTADGNESSAGNESSTDNETSGEGGGGGQEVPVFGSYLSDANGYAEADTVDARGQDSVTVAVGAGEGGIAFDPATVWVSPGTTITWEWTGEGGGHNVVTNDGPAALDSGSAQESGTYEYDFTEEDAGLTTYKCNPHETEGMKGGVAVGEDVETTTVETGGAGGPSVTIPDEALSLTIATFIAMTTTLGLGFFFMKYGGDQEPQ
jgi:halocyanin-like protein